MIKKWEVTRLLFVARARLSPSPLTVTQIDKRFWCETSPSDGHNYFAADGTSDVIDLLLKPVVQSSEFEIILQDSFITKHQAPSNITQLPSTEDDLIQYLKQKL